MLIEHDSCYDLKDYVAMILIDVIDPQDGLLRIRRSRNRNRNLNRTKMASKLMKILQELNKKSNREGKKGKHAEKSMKRKKDERKFHHGLKSYKNEKYLGDGAHEDNESKELRDKMKENEGEEDYNYNDEENQEEDADDQDAGEEDVDDEDKNERYSHDKHGHYDVIGHNKGRNSRIKDGAGKSNEEEDEYNEKSFEQYTNTNIGQTSSGGTEGELDDLDEESLSSPAENEEQYSSKPKKSNGIEDESQGSQTDNAEKLGSVDSAGAAWDDYDEDRDEDFEDDASDLRPTDEAHSVLERSISYDEDFDYQSESDNLMQREKRG